MTEIANKIFQAGGDPDVLTLQGDETEWGSPNGWLSAYDALQWEAFFRENDLYVRAMWDERWDGTDLWKAIRDDRVYLCFLHQLDFNRLLEEGEGAILRKEQRDDIGVALLPAGASLQLSEEGLPVRRGRSASQVSGWWWGIPKEANKARSLDVIREILRDDFHAEEVADFGFLPVTKRVRRLRDDEVEREGGIGSQIWLKSWTQLDFAVQKRTWFRHDARWTPIQSCWLDAWDQVMKIEPNPEGVRPGHKSHDPIWCALSRLCRRLARIRGMDPESCFACTRPSLSAARAR